MADRKMITDPQRLKALAHPIRWKLLDALSIAETATATQCAAAIGESVASCSYHLNMLAKYGFVEQAEGGQGREKPWRLAERERSYDHEGLDEEGVLAAEAATDAFLEHEFDRVRTYLRGHGRESEEWRRAFSLMGMHAHLTPDEAIGLQAEVQSLFDRYRDRSDNSALRPSGSRPVRFLLTNFVIPDTPETP
ncbi:helix-turn-helix domain-containing protein [Actinokineospora sp. UTMC 2448]|uniref:winged helix-turn-helix domain-containing protein n=1 Tax=Actinokineospora sp. UTMC 2448 TaxID=2268449 RepID=UPI002164AC6D|nr:helix-turn-helix domain-containing protein [Actinokineospora sp. UTMC 2448]UVS82622.1 Helix-turn-helix domain protein [Actinokineospora sp. UTMC 2448]